MNRHGLAVIVTVLLVSCGAISVSAATVNPRFEAYVQDPIVTPGTTSEVTVQFVNSAEDSGDTTRTARQVRVTMQSGETPFTIQSGTRLLGTMANDESESATFRITTPRSITPGTYQVPVTVQYEYTGGSGNTTMAVPIQVESVARFSVVSAGSTATIGGTGTFDVVIENTGTELASDARVVVESTDPEFSFGSDGSRSEAFVGAWSPGETMEAAFQVRFTDEAIVRNYTVRTTVAFLDSSGQSRSESFSVGIRPSDRQSFVVEDIQSDLSVGSQGTVSGRVVNQRGSTVSDAVVLLRAEGSNLSPQTTEYPIGDLEPGQGEVVRFPIDVPDTAVPGPRRVTFQVQYENSAGDILESDPIGVRVSISERQPSFSLTPVDAMFEIGESGTLTLEIQNNREERVREVTATLSSSDPIEVEDSTAFISSMEAGETDQLVFGIDVSNDARAKTYPVTVEISYRSAAGTLHEPSEYRLGIDVVTEAGESVPVAPFVAGAIIVVLAGLWWYSRR